MISPVIFFSLVIGVIAGFQYFTQAYVASFAVSGQTAGSAAANVGSPQGSMLFYSLYLYVQGFADFRMGYASAMAWILFLITMAVHDPADPGVAPLGLLPGRLPIAAIQTAARAPAAAIKRRPVPPDVRRRRFLMTVGKHTVLIAVSAMFLLPVVFILLTSIMTDGQALTPQLWPRPFRLQNFPDVFHQIPLIRYTWNTFQISVASTVAVVVSCVPVAYALSRIRWRGRQAAFLAVISTMMLPFQVTVIPLYIVFVRFHWIPSMKPLIIPLFFGDAFSIFLLRQFFLDDPRGAVGRRPRRRRERVPDHDAGDRPAGEARDRGGRLFQFLYSWNDFFAPLLYLLEKPQLWTLAIGLSQFRSLHHVQWNLTMAASVLFMLPVIILFFLAQRVFIEGVTLTGVKG